MSEDDDPVVFVADRILDVFLAGHVLDVIACAGPEALAELTACPDPLIARLATWAADGRADPPS